MPNRQPTLGYVLYPEKEPEKLKVFLSQDDTTEFTPVAYIDPTSLALLGDKDILFNSSKAKEKLGREVTFNEIAKTLSHIKCWKMIAENETLTDQDFALIAENEACLINNYQKYVRDYINTYPYYGIIKLQRSNAIIDERLLKEGDNVHAVVYPTKDDYNNSGSSFYLIRKDMAKELILKLTQEKPYWLSDYFGEFCSPDKIVQAFYLLSEIPEKKDITNRTPLFSIIIPVYNVERYLKQCIDSVLMQDAENYEIVLINDGSSDTSLEICLEYIKTNPNITLIHKINTGVSDSRNKGINLARGKYLIFLDSDDYWEGTTILSDLEKIYNEYHPDVIFNYMTSVSKNLITYHTLDFHKKYGDFHQDFKELYEKEVYVGFPVSKVIKNELIIENALYFHPERKFEDVLWSFNLIRHIKTYAVYPKPFYMYRREREGSISHTVKKENVKDQLNNFIDIIKELEMLLEAVPMLSLMAKKYVKDVSRFTLHCYGLLPQHDQEELKPLESHLLELVQRYLD